MNRLLGAGCYSGTALSSMTERLSTDALLSFGHKYDFLPEKSVPASGF